MVGNSDDEGVIGYNVAGCKSKQDLDIHWQCGDDGVVCLVSPYRTQGYSLIKMLWVVCYEADWVF